MPIALASARRGTDLDPAGADISADFSNDTSLFSYGSTPQPGKYDFTTVVLHEIGHGLGFAGDMDVQPDSSGVHRGYWDPGTTRPRPFVFDRYTVTPRADGSTTPLLSLQRGSTTLAAALTTGRSQWDGPAGRAANGGVRPELYTPSTWQQGSSYSHLDENTYPAGDANSLMTPELDLGEVIRDPGAITLGMLDDEGWGSSTVAASPSPTASPSPSASPGSSPAATPTASTSPSAAPPASAGPSAAASPSVSSSPGAAATSLRLTGPSNVAAGRTVPVPGVAPAGSAVRLFFKRRGSTTTSPGAQPGYVLTREVTAQPNGSFATTFLASDDHRYYAQVGDQVSDTVLTQVRPSFAGATTRVVRRGTTLTMTGRGLPGTPLTLRFSHGSTSGLRTVTTRSDGTWSRSVVLIRDLRVSARGANGLASDPNLLLQAR